MKPSLIEERARQLLNPVLSEAVKQRTEAGVKKYGQRLDDNHQPERAKAIHLIQELMDGCQYALWLDLNGLARTLAKAANGVQQQYGLSVTEIMEGGKQ